MLSSPYSGPRAGFWRRVLAFSLDCLLIGAVTALIGPLAFSSTGGRIQIGGVGVSSLSCAGVSTVPAGLDPPPPEGSNHAEVCDAGALPFVVSERFLRVGRKAVTSGRISDVSRAYPLSAAGVPDVATDLTWVVQLGFLTYLVTGLVRRGRTLGMRALRIRLVSLADAPSRGVSLWRVLLRAVIAVGGFVPAFLELRSATTGPSGAAAAALLEALFLWIAWASYNLNLVVRKRDPVYDRLAGVAVLVQPV